MLKPRVAVALVLAAVIVPADASAGRPTRRGRFVVDRGRVRFQEKIRSRHRFVVHHEQGSGDVSTTVRSGKLLRKGLARTITPRAGGSTESTGEYFREGPFGVAHVTRGTDHIVIGDGTVHEELDRKPILRRRRNQQRRSTVAGGGASAVEVTDGDRSYHGLSRRDASDGRPGLLGRTRKVLTVEHGGSAADVVERKSLLERFSPSVFGESVTVGHEQTERGAGFAVSRETSITQPRRISRTTELHRGGVSSSEGTVEKHGRMVRRDQVRVSDRDGHRIEQYLRPNGRERKQIETWAGHDGVTTVIITRYRRNGSRWMATTLRSDRDGARRPERVFYRRDGITPRPPLFERD